MKKIIRIATAVAVLIASSASAVTIEINVNGLVCAFCAQGIEKKLRKLPATADVVVSLEQRLVAVSLKDDQDIPDSELRKALTDAGYTVTSIQRTDVPIFDRADRFAPFAIDAGAFEYPQTPNRADEQLCRRSDTVRLRGTIWRKANFHAGASLASAPPTSYGVLIIQHWILFQCLIFPK